MLKRALEILDDKAPLAHDRSGRSVSKEIRLAVAALLVEMACSDAEYVVEERDMVIKELAKEFGISKRESKKLAKEAESHVSSQITNLGWIDKINQTYNEEQKIEILSVLWKIVEADKVVEEFEPVLARHIRILLNLSVEQASYARACMEKD